MSRGFVVLALVLLWHNAWSAFAEVAGRLPHLA